jgi:hypothetical protein
LRDKSIRADRGGDRDSQPVTSGRVDDVFYA